MILASIFNRILHPNKALGANMQCRYTSGMFIQVTDTIILHQTAEVENYMASVKTVTRYSHGHTIVQEAPHDIADTTPPQEWPAQGAIEFSEITMRYRTGLPFVPKGVVAR